jgi:hypothetical protein
MATNGKHSPKSSKNYHQYKISYTRKQARNEWFDEECEMVNKQENAARARALGVKTRNAKNAYKQAHAEERNLFGRKSR